MRIGIDLSSLENGAQHRGIGRYVTELLQTISSIDKTNEYIFFVANTSITKPSFNFATGFKSKYVVSNGTSWKRRAKFIRTLIVSPEPLDIRNHKLDVYFQIDIQRPVISGGTPIVSVLFDLIPFLFKEYYQTAKLKKISIPEFVFYFREKLKWRYAEKALQNYKKSAMIISISEHSKKDLLNFLPQLKETKIKSIPLAAGSTRIKTSNPGKELIKLKNKNFLFYVGGADPRKGLVGLVKDMERVWTKYPDTTLVLAGKEVTNPDVQEAVRLKVTIEECSKPEKIILLGFIEDTQLAWLYDNAIAFVFPSIYEGFGLPILEAMQAGCPVIAYNNSSIPEVAGEAAMLVETNEPIADAINTLLSNIKLREKLAGLGKKQEKLFTWEKTAKDTLKVLINAGKMKR